MAKKRTSPNQLTRMQARTRALRGGVRFVLIACCLAFGFVVVAATFPQTRKLRDMEAKLLEARQREQQVMFERECSEIELRALREDPEYLELHARDRLGYCLPGERVLRFTRKR